jgi:hypothetical protein
MHTTSHRRSQPELHHPRACLRTRRRTPRAGVPTAQFLSFGETSKSRPSSESRRRFRCIYRNFQDEAVILKEMRVEKRRSIVCMPLPLGGAGKQPIQYQDSICPISVFDAEQSELCPWMSRAGVRAIFRLSPLFSCNGSLLLRRSHDTNFIWRRVSHHQSPIGVRWESSNFVPQKS